MTYRILFVALFYVFNLGLMAQEQFWVKQFTSDYTNSPVRCAFNKLYYDSLSNIYFSGIVGEKNARFLNENKNGDSIATLGMQQGLVGKLSPKGELLWVKSIGAEGYSSPEQIHYDYDGILGLHFNEKEQSIRVMARIDGYSPRYTHCENDEQGVYMYSFNMDGDLNWCTNFQQKKASYVFALDHAFNEQAIYSFTGSEPDTLYGPEDFIFSKGRSLFSLDQKGKVNLLYQDTSLEVIRELVPVSNGFVTRSDQSTVHKVSPDFSDTLWSFSGSNLGANAKYTIQQMNASNNFVYALISYYDNVILGDDTIYGLLNYDNHVLVQLSEEGKVKKHYNFKSDVDYPSLTFTNRNSQAKHSISFRYRFYDYFSLNEEAFTGDFPLNHRFYEWHDDEGLRLVYNVGSQYAIGPMFNKKYRNSVYNHSRKDYYTFFGQYETDLDFGGGLVLGNDNVRNHAFMVKLHKNALSLKEPPVPASFKLFPNPSQGQLSVAFSRELFGEVAPVSVYNAQGQLLYQEKMEAGPKVDLDLNHLPAGFYYLHWANNAHTRKGFVLH